MTEIIPRLFLGNQADARDMSAREKNHIKAILTVCSEAELVVPIPIQGIKYDQLALFDTGHNEYKKLEKILALIETRHLLEEPCLVHCSAGNSRSPSCVAAYLFLQDRPQKFDHPDQAMDFLLERYQPTLGKGVAQFSPVWLQYKQMFQRRAIA